jgi:hypothetical protein
LVLWCGKAALSATRCVGCTPPLPVLATLRSRSGPGLVGDLRSAIGDISRPLHSATSPVCPHVLFWALARLVFMFRLFLGSVVFASLVSSVGLVSLVQSVLSFGLMCGAIVLVGVLVGWLLFGVLGGSQSGELAGESVEFGPVAARVSCARGCSGCAAGCGLVASVAALPAGCALVAGRSGRRLSGAALSGRVRSLVAGGVLAFG